MNTEIVEIPVKTVEASEIGSLNRGFTAKEIKAQVNLIQEVMAAVMKEGTHYGTIPGCPKPSLYKPGSEKLNQTFRIADEPHIEDLSTEDEVRYRIVSRAVSMLSGRLLATGLGECSSLEEKYKWRRAVCDEEWNETPEDRRREKWARSQNGAYKTKQVRTNKADVANTVLKMADKRACVAATLKATAASDIFTQDLEEMPPEMAEEMVEQNGDQKPAPAAPTRKSESQPQNGQTYDRATMKPMTAKFDSKCPECGGEIVKDTMIFYDSTRKKAFHHPACK